MTDMAAPDPKPTRVSKHARWSAIIGAAIAIVGLAFVARSITNEWSTLSSSLADARPLWLAAGVLCAALAMLGMALPWRRALSMLGAHVERRSGVAYYFAGEIGKYVPGGIWPVLGRGELARSGGVAPTTSYASVVLSLGALYLAAMVLVVILLPLWLLTSGSIDLLWMLALLPVGLAALHPRPLGWLIARVERVLGRQVDIVLPPWSASIGLVARYVPSWLFVSTATWCIARAFDGNVSWIQVAPAAVLSWIVGFVLVPIPGGIGVREAAFVGLVGGLSSGVAATVAIAARLSFMLVDGVGALLAGVALRRARRRALPRAPSGTTAADAGAA
jgi:uncharacterized membrane protein YbhN (UPF0104 family)